MKDRAYLVALSTISGIGPIRTTLLLGYFKSARNIWEASQKDLLDTGLNPRLVEKFVRHRRVFDISNYLKRLTLYGVKLLIKGEPNYPTNLKDLSDSPYVLYVRGTYAASDKKSVAIVGTRLMTEYGKKMAQKFSYQLAEKGITVISGLALGIDAAAQQAAMAFGGRTISVLASGVDIISPLKNKPLALEFISQGQGAVISENPLGYEPHPYDFPIRDRLIAGLSRAVIVIEGRMKSGTFHTVRSALDYGRSVFAVPGPITSPTSEAPNYLIQNGAKLITNVEDVVNEVNLS